MSNVFDAVSAVFPEPLLAMHAHGLNKWMIMANFNLSHS